jgi:hypothetical protein
VAKSPRSDSSILCFLVFYSIVNTPNKKKSKHKIPSCPPLFWYLPSKSKLCRICYSFFATEGSTLEANSSVRFFFNIYVVVRKVFCQFDVLGKFVSNGGRKLKFFNWYQWGPQFKDKWDLNKSFLVKVWKHLENLSKNPKLKIWLPCSNLHLL